MKRREILPSEVTPNTILRLADAARLAFPDGSITVASLRREAARGRLTIWRIAGKDMTSLAEIDLMKERCRVPAREGANQMPQLRSEPEDVSLIAAGITSQDALRIKIQKRQEGIARRTP